MQMVMHAKVGWEVEHWRMGWGAVDQWPAVNDEGARKQVARNSTKVCGRRATWDVTVQRGKNCRSGARLSIVNNHRIDG